MTPTEQLAKRMAEVTDFCLCNRGRCWRGWSDMKIAKYLACHAILGGLFVLRSAGKVCSVAIGMCGHASEFIGNAENNRPQFYWRSPEPGNALLICEVIGKRRYCGQLFKMALDKWPHVSRIFTYRQKAGRQHEPQQFIELHLKDLERFYGWA